MLKLNVSQRVRCYSFALEVQLTLSQIIIEYLLCAGYCGWCSESVTIDTDSYPSKDCKRRQASEMSIDKFYQEESFAVAEHRRDTICLSEIMERLLEGAGSGAEDWVEYLILLDGLIYTPLLTQKMCNMLVIPWYPLKTVVSLYLHE